MGFTDHDAACVFSYLSLWTGKLIVVKVGMSIIALEDTLLLALFLAVINKHAMCIKLLGGIDSSFSWWSWSDQLC